jgi:hypothetical protein
VHLPGEADAVGTVRAQIVEHARRAAPPVLRVLLGLASGTKFIITGLVLLAAVTVDSLARRNLASSGRA